MSRVFVGHADASPFTDLTGKRFGDVLVEAQKTIPALTWKELARYNWGTDDARAVNRALAETVGCAEVDDADPTNTTLDTKAGPGGDVKILLPKFWKADNLAVEKTHTIKVMSRAPAPAVSITELTRWFVPGKPCTIGYALEGPSSHADKVDLEIHAHNYFEESKDGDRQKSATTAAAESTFIYQRRKVTDVTTPDAPSKAFEHNTWKGESEATKGVLKVSKTQPVYINHDCAPYTALARFYKNDADNQATLTLNPFYPQWKPTGALIEESLVVSWEIKLDNGKLKQGQLLVFDKNNRCVFRAALSEKRLRTDKKYDLVKDTAHAWDQSKIVQDQMPYRVQIQAHSLSSETSGLAVAAMHTAVKPFIYKRAQMIGFNIRPGTKKNPTETYRGKKDDTEDITARCEAMKRAIRAGAASGSLVNDEDVLKVFVAPEFYFRGEQGAYPVEEVTNILADLRRETDRFEYADWLFVFGTIIAALPHEAKPTAPARYSGDAKHNATIVDIGDGTTMTVEIKPNVAKLIDSTVALKVPWTLNQKGQPDTPIVGAAPAVTPSTPDPAPPSGKPVRYTITLAAKKAFALGEAMLLEPLNWVVETGKLNTDSAIRVRSNSWKKIPVTSGTLNSTAWRAEQGPAKGYIKETMPQTDGTCWLIFNGAPTFKEGPVELVEPQSTEIVNVALVQKGWPAAALGPKGVKAAAVFKEYVSSIDFIGNNTDANKFSAADGGGRLITVNGKANRMVLPVAGSRDMLGASPSEPPATGATNRPVWHDKDGIEHQVGSEINTSGQGGGSVVTFDGITFGVEVCLDHLMERLDNFYKSSAQKGDPKIQILLVPSWGMTLGAGPCRTVPNGLLFNVDGSRVESIARLSDGAYSCDAHPAEKGTGATSCPACPTVETPSVCPACGTFQYRSATQCGICGGALVQYYQCTTDGWGPTQTCQTCKTVLPKPDKPATPKTFQAIGTGLNIVDSPAVNLTGLPSGAWTDYFTRQRPLSIFEVKPIPPAAVV